MDGEHDQVMARGVGLPMPPLGVTVALLALVLSTGYVALFGYMVWVSLLEQYFSVPAFLPRYATPTHFHNTAEWFLLTLPTVIGLTGIVASVRYLVTRWLRGA